MTYTALDLSKYIIHYSNEKLNSISNLKLQKILYFLWIEYYRIMNQPLFLDEICAWKLGPVVPNVYYEYCFYAGSPLYSDKSADLDEADIKIVNRILDKYLRISSSKLVEQTHKQGTPWDIIYQDGVGNRKCIPFSLIIDKGEVVC